MLQFIRAPNFWYVYVRRYQQFCTLMADSLRELRTAVREWECCKEITLNKLLSHLLQTTLLMHSTVGKIFGRQHIEIMFCVIFQKTGFDISCKFVSTG